MASFGEKLRQERESRKTKLDDIAGSTKIRIRFLEALEQNEFEELPGPAFGKFFIRAYAEALDIDPEPLIAEYDREQKRRAEIRATGAEERPRGDVQSRIRDRLRRWTSTERPHERIPESAVELEPDAGDEEPETIPHTEPLVVRSEQPADFETEPHRSAEVEPEAVFEPSVTGETLETPVCPATASQGEAPSPGPLGLRPRTLALGAIGLSLLVVLAIVFFPFRDSDGELSDAMTAAPSTGGESESLDRSDVAPGAEGEAAQAPPPREAAREPEEPVSLSKDRPAPTPASSGEGLSIAEFGIGRDVVDRRLEDAGDRFEEGTTVFFWTRVVGGRRGQSIHHVWLHDGRAVQSVALDIGGPHWRTYSRKTLWGTGAWTVEARDPDGEVLARATFTCVPGSS